MGIITGIRSIIFISGKSDQCTATYHLSLSYCFTAMIQPIR